MKKYLHMDDNEDGTTTVSFSIDGVTEHTTMMLMDLDNIFAAVQPMVSSANEEIHEFVAQNAVIIPNEV